MSNDPRRTIAKLGNDLSSLLKGTLRPETEEPSDDTKPHGDVIRRLRDGLRKAKTGLLERDKRLLVLQREVEVAKERATQIASVLLVMTEEVKPFRTGTHVEILRGDHAGKKGKVAQFTEGAAVVEFHGGGQAIIEAPGDGTADMKQIGKPPKPKTLATVALNGQQMVVTAPDGLDLVPGESVRIDMQTHNIVAKAPMTAVGEVVNVRAVLDDGACEVEAGGGTRLVLPGKFSGTIKKGNRVLLDPGKLVICRDFGRFDGKFLSTGNRPVEWDEIGGNEEAKQALREAIELPHTEGDLFAHYGKKPTSGIIFLGPPGCGKTLLARAAATSMARRYKMAGALKGFIYVKGPECKNMWYGNTEATVRALFGQARQFKEEHGFPAIICVDEADAIVRTRGTRGGLDVDDSTVNAFLAEMDGLEESGACMMLLTNRADTIDPAILRDGRIDRKITVKRPTREDAATIFMINLKKKPLLGGPSSLDRLVGDAADSLYSDKHVLLDLSRTGGGKVPFHLRNIASGALVAGIVEEAILLAMRRDRTAATKTGIGIDELLGAIEAKCAQNKAIDHSEAIADFAKSLQPEAQHAAQ